MDAYKSLRRQAQEKRDYAIRAARAEYAQALREIARLARIMRVANHRLPPVQDRKVRYSDSDGKPFSGKTLVVAVETVLRDSGPLRLTELTLEVQRRGCRAGDDPRRVAHAIRSAFTYHRARFRRDKAGRWAVAARH